MSVILINSCFLLIVDNQQLLADTEFTEDIS